MPKLNIFLDLDETLVLSHRIATYQPVKPEYNPIQFDDRGTPWVTYLRPGALEFVKACAEIAPTFILTAGNSDFQKRVVALHNLDIHVFGREDYAKLPTGDCAILVDDLHIETCGAQLKLEALRAGLPQVEDWPLTEYGRPQEHPKHFRLVNVKSWYAPRPDTELMDTTLPAIKAIVASLEVPDLGCPKPIEISI